MGHNAGDTLAHLEMAIHFRSQLIQVERSRRDARAIWNLATVNGSNEAANAMDNIAECVGKLDIVSVPRKLIQ